MLQYEAVLTRPEHLAAASISTADVEVLLDALSVVVEPVRISYLWRPVLPDSVLKSASVAAPVAVICLVIAPLHGRLFGLAGRATLSPVFAVAACQ